MLRWTKMFKTYSRLPFHNPIVCKRLRRLSRAAQTPCLAWGTWTNDWCPNCHRKSYGFQSHPRFKLLPPPGGLKTRVVGVSDKTFPQFWSAPFAKELDDTRTRWPKVSAFWLSCPQARLISEWPPGGLDTRVVGTPVRTLPVFWLWPLA